MMFGVKRKDLTEDNRSNGKEYTCMVTNTESWRHISGSNKPVLTAVHRIQHQTLSFRLLKGVTVVVNHFPTMSYPSVARTEVYVPKLLAVVSGTRLLERTTRIQRKSSYYYRQNT